MLWSIIPWIGLVCTIAFGWAISLHSYKHYREEKELPNAWRIWVLRALGYDLMLLSTALLFVVLILHNAAFLVFVGMLCVLIAVPIILRTLTLRRY